MMRNDTASASDLDRVFTVWHFRAKFDDRLEYSHEKEDGQQPRCLGLFSTRERALAAIDHCRGQPGFREWPDSFDILWFHLDEAAWETGFFTWPDENDE